MRIYRGYATDDSWTHSDVSEDAVLAYIAKRWADGPLTLRERDSESTAYFEDSEGGEFCVEWFDIEPSPAAFTQFLNDHEC